MGFPCREPSIKKTYLKKFRGGFSPLSPPHWISLWCSLLTSGGSNQWRIQAFGRRQKGLHLLKYKRLSATILKCHTKVVTFCRPKSGYFYLSNYAIFQRITTVWNCFISLIQKTFETVPKQWASFFTSYTYHIQRRSQGGGSRGSSPPLSNQNIDVYFLSYSPTL